MDEEILVKQLMAEREASSFVESVIFAFFSSNFNASTRDSHNTGRPYDAAARREPYISNDPPQPTTPKTPRSATYDTSATMQAPSTPSKTRRASTPTPGRDAAEAEVPTRSRTVSLGGIQAAYSNGDGRKISVGSNSGPKTKSKQDDLQAQVAELTARLEEVRVIAKALEKERNFYYKKLRHVESLVQDKLEKGNTGQVPLLKEIEAVLYQTEEGFQKPHVVEQQTPKVQENSVNALTVMPAAAAGLTVEAISPILSLFFGGTSEPAPQPQPQPQPPQQSQQTQQPSPTSSQTKPSLPVSEERGLKSALSLGSAKSSEKLHTQQPPPQLPIKRVAFESDKPPLFFTKFEDLKDLKSLQAALDMAIDSIDDSIDD
ncbi:hypothetical protein HK102_012718 [Quaeritorhiza haematococci]|nr:hypothetical protein HK102_012718 [Quaeritorhiza haematococci]